jgi:glutamine amidotransferase
VARVTSSGAVLAAVRDATPGTAQGEAAVAPFASGPWLFSHNGIVNGWPGSPAVTRLAAPLGIGSLLSLEAHVDSALLWAMVLHRLRAGLDATAALASVVTDLAAAGVTGRFNFLLTDGRSIVATAAGDTLWYRRAGGGVTVASEPCDAEPGWTEVPDRRLLTAVPSQVTVRPLSALRSDSPSEGMPIR